MVDPVVPTTHAFGSLECCIGLTLQAGLTSLVIILHQLAILPAVSIVTCTAVSFVLYFPLLIG